MKETIFRKMKLAVSVLVVAIAVLVFTPVTSHAAGTTEKEVVVKKLEGNSIYKSASTGGSAFGDNFGTTLEDEKDLKYKVYFSDGTSSTLTPSNCNALKQISNLRKKGQKFDRILVCDCNNIKKLIGIVYALDDGETIKFTMLNKDGSYYKGFSGFKKDINTFYDSTRKGVISPTNYKTTVKNGVAIETADIDSRLSYSFKNPYTEYLMDIIDKPTGKKILTSVVCSIKGGKGEKYYFSKEDKNGNFLGLYEVSYKDKTPQLKKASLKFQSSSIIKTYGSAAFTNKLTKATNGALTYQSSNRSVAVVDKNGKVTIKGVGTAKITVSAKQTSKYKSSKITYTLKVNPKKTRITQLTAKSKGFTVKYSKQSSQTTGYQVQHATNKDFKNAVLTTIRSNKTTSTTVRNLASKRRCYVRVRTYRKVDGKNYYSAWSDSKTITTK